jgi:hypothetical protein
MLDLASHGKKAPHPALIGVVHLLPTPGSPGFSLLTGSFDQVLERAAGDARALAEGGADALIVENFGDAPFFGERVPAETIAALTAAVRAVRAEVATLPVGVNVLRNDARAGLGICACTGAAFLRVNVHVGAMVTDQGLLEGRAAETLRERARLCPDVLIAADVHVKHARPLADQSLAEAARDARERGRADVLIVSGVRTGDPPAARDLALLREILPGTPLWIGSGLDADNAGRLLALADGAIVGTSLKRGGEVAQAVDPQRVERLRAVFDTLTRS